MELRELAKKLSLVVGEENVLYDSNRVKRYRKDALMSFRAFNTPKWVSEIVVTRPASTEEVAEIVRIANREKMPVIPYGGGTGLMGGATALQPSIVIDLSRMCRVLEVDEVNRSVTAEAGVTLEELDKTLRKKGLMLAHDPWSSPRATLGGSISTNGMGYFVAGYGPMRRQVLGLEVVLPTGEILRTRPAEHNSAGPSLAQLFIGSEGVFGIITKATVRAYPLPEKEQMMGYEFQRFEDCFRAVQEIHRKKAVPSVLDAGEDVDGFGDPTEDYPTQLFLLIEGFREEVDAKSSRLAEICEEYGGVKLGEEWAEDFWKHRHDLIYYYDKFLREGSEPDWIGDNILDYVHLYLPAGKGLEDKKKSGEIMKEHGRLIRERGLWGHPELFSTVFLRPATPDRETAKKEAMKAVDKMIELCHTMGGSMEYCHGVGIRLAHHMQREHGEAGLQLLRRIKQAIGPNNIMNPGKLAL